MVPFFLFCRASGDKTHGFYLEGDELLEYMDPQNVSQDSKAYMGEQRPILATLSSQFEHRL